MALAQPSPMKLALLAALLLSTRAFAEEDPPQQTEMRQIAEADLVAAGIGVAAAVTCINACHSFQPVTFGIGAAAFGVFALGPSIAFLRQDEPVKAALSVALRVGLPIATYYALNAVSNATSCSSTGPDTGFPCGMGSVAAVMVAGGAATLIAPYLLTIGDRPVTPMVTGRTFGLAGRF